RGLPDRRRRDEGPRRRPIRRPGHAAPAPDRRRAAAPGPHRNLRPPGGHPRPRPGPGDPPRRRVPRGPARCRVLHYTPFSRHRTNFPPNPDSRRRSRRVSWTQTVSGADTAPLVAEPAGQPDRGNGPAPVPRPGAPEMTPTPPKGGSP